MLFEKLESRSYLTAAGSEAYLPMSRPLRNDYIPIVVLPVGHTTPIRPVTRPTTPPVEQPATPTPPLVQSTWDKLQSIDFTNFVIPEAPANTKPDLTPLAEWLLIGGGSANNSNRHIGYGVVNGWEWVTSSVVNPTIEWFKENDLDPRIVLHNPFGVLDGREMEFDQAIHAAEGVEGVHGPMPKVLSNFVELWKPITDSGVEVTAYLGTLRHDPDFENLSDEAWFERFKESVKLPIQAGMGIGFDNAVLATADSRTYKAAELLRSLGVAVSVEARPALQTPEWNNFPVVIEESFYHRSNPAKYADARALYAPDSVLTGGISRIFTGYLSTPRNQLLEQVNSAFNAGHTVMIQVHWLRADGITVQNIDGKLQLVNP